MFPNEKEVSEVKKNIKPLDTLMKTIEYFQTQAVYIYIYIKALL